VQFNANKLQSGGGSGLGLYITKGIVDQHDGGKIWCESAGEGHGCTFLVEVPTVKLDDAVVALQSEEEAEEDHRREAAVMLNRVSVSSIRKVSSLGLGQRLDGARSYSMRLNAADVGKDDMALVPAPAPAPAATATAVAEFKPLILVVDDSAMNRRMLCRMLEHAGFNTVQVRRDIKRESPWTLPHRGPSHCCPLARSPFSRRSQAAHGLDAVAIISHISVIRRQSSSESNVKVVHDVVADATVAPAGDAVASPPTLPNPPVSIMIDSNMPVMNGPDAIVEIRKLGYDFPIFGVTGDDDVERFIRAGADGVLLKPVRVEDLLHRYVCVFYSFALCCWKEYTGGTVIMQRGMMETAALTHIVRHIRPLLCVVQAQGGHPQGARTGQSRGRRRDAAAAVRVGFVAEDFRPGQVQQEHGRLVRHARRPSQGPAQGCQAQGQGVGIG